MSCLANRWSGLRTRPGEWGPVRRRGKMAAGRESRRRDFGEPSLVLLTTTMDAPQFLTVAEVRRVDAYAIETLGIPSLALMENAARDVVEALVGFDPSFFHDPGRHPPRIAIFCGRGNNAGDGYAVARHLSTRGVTPTTLALAPPEGLRGDAQHNYQTLIRCGLPVRDLSESASLEADLLKLAGDCDWLIDALLGTGAQGEPREPLAAAIRWMNGRPARRLAIDLPTGLDADRGEPTGVCVKADLTVTFVAAKIGFSKPQAAPWIGKIRVAPIGVPPRIIAAALR